MKDEQHHSHNYEDLSKAFVRYKMEMKSSLEPIKEQLMIVEEALTQLDTRCDEIANQRAVIEADIFSSITKLQETLEVRKTELIGQVCQLTETKLKCLAIQRDQLEITRAQLSSCLHFIKEECEFHESEVLLMKKTEIKQIKDLTATFTHDELKPNTYANIIFSARADLTIECQSYGNVYAAGPPDLSKCHIQGEGVNTAVVGEKYIVSLQLLNHESQPCNLPLTSISCELLRI